MGPEGIRGPADDSVSVIVPADGATAAKPQEYSLGWLFVFLHLPLGLLIAVRERSLNPGVLAVSTWYTLFALSAAIKRPWTWHILLAGLLVDIALGLALRLGGHIRMDSPSWLEYLGFSILNLLWFTYFYRRRAMFGAATRWGWVENSFPSMVGPDVYVPQPRPRSLPPLVRYFVLFLVIVIVILTVLVVLALLLLLALYVIGPLPG